MKLALVVALTAPLLLAETPLEFSNETRFQLDVQVPAAALQALLPQGWTQNAATTGAAKDCNLRVIFIDRVSINDASKPNGGPLGKGTEQLVWLAAPVKDPSGKAVQMIVGGITGSPADAPGPFGNYLAAKSVKANRFLMHEPLGGEIESQEWSFVAATGEHLDMTITYERNAAPKRDMSDTPYYSSKNPSVYQISRQELVLDIMRNVTTNPPDHVRSFTFTAGGGSYAKLFDGTEKMLSWDNVLWMNRTVLKP